MKVIQDIYQDKHGKIIPVYPSWCCQKCGDDIGWIGRFFQLLKIKLHRC